MATVSLPNRFYAGTVLAAETTVYTTAASQTDVITSVTFANLTDVTATVTMKMAQQFLLKTLDVPPRSVIVLDFKQVLNTAEFIQLAASSNNAISCFISGVKINQVS